MTVNMNNFLLYLRSKYRITKMILNIIIYTRA